MHAEAKKGQYFICILNSRSQPRSDAIIMLALSILLLYTASAPYYYNQRQIRRLGQMMLPKIDNKRLLQSYYPKLLTGSSNDENILKLKIIQQFLQEDTYVQRPTPLQHKKQSSLHSYRHIDQENMKKHTSNASNQLYHIAKIPKASSHQSVERRQSTHRPQTKRQCLRLSELVDITFRENKQPNKKQLNFRNYKIL